MHAIIISRSAAKDYGRIPNSQIPRINRTIDGLASNPRPSGYKKLKNRDAYRVRVGDYRIIYEINDEQLILLVIRVRHRKEVYRDF